MLLRGTLIGMTEIYRMSPPARLLQASLDRRLRRWIPVLAILTGLAGCQSENAGSTPSGMRPSADAAVRSNTVTKAGGSRKSSQASPKLEVISEKLTVAAGTTPISIRVVNASGPNAALGPDGDIYLTRQLLQLTGDDSEVAAVIAHEIAHKLADHAAARSNAGTQAAISSDEIAKLLPDSDRVKALLAERSARVAELSRQQELEADTMAIRLLAKAGYDPSAVARFLKVMQANDEAQTSDRRTYTSFHPAPDMRIERAESLAANF